jgi:hypothetical protein
VLKLFGAVRLPGEPETWPGEVEAGENALQVPDAELQFRRWRPREGDRGATHRLERRLASAVRESGDSKRTPPLQGIAQQPCGGNELVAGDEGHALPVRAGLERVIGERHALHEGRPPGEGRDGLGDGRRQEVALAHWRVHAGARVGDDSTIGATGGPGGGHVDGRGRSVEQGEAVDDGRRPVGEYGRSRPRRGEQPQTFQLLASGALPPDLLEGRMARGLDGSQVQSAESK